MVNPAQEEFDYPSLKVLTINNHKGGVGKTSLSKIITEYFLNKGEFNIEKVKQVISEHI